MAESHRLGGMAARFLVSHPCQDACGVTGTDEVVEGAPVYSCPGCDTRWIELHERGTVTVPDAATPQEGGSAS